MRLTPQRKRLILVGVSLILVGVLVKQFVLVTSVPASVSAPVLVRHHAKHALHVKAVAARPVPVTPTLPASLRQQLALHGVVVAVLYAPGANSDQAALAAARQGAQGAHAGFAVIDVSNEAVARKMAVMTPGAADPSVLVVRRPGTITVLLPGYTDANAVAEAALNAR